MRNERNLLFSKLSVEQTDLLIGSIDRLPVGGSIVRSVRNRVLLSASPNSLKRRRLGRTLLPVAACLIAIAVFFVSFPKAALAVSEFFGRVFTPSRYMNEDPAERTSVPSIDEAIAAAAPKNGDYTITLMPDLPNAQEFIDYRAQNGYAPFSEENWGWLRDVRPEIAEVLYDGNQLIWNTNLFTTNEHVREFMEGYGVHSGSKLSVDALMDDVTYTVAGDPTVYPLYVSGHGITPIYDEAALAAADHVVLYSDFDIDPENPLPDGVLTITQNILVCENDAMDYGATVAIITHTFTFDTTKGNTAAAEANETLISLSGETYLSMNHFGSEATETDSDWTVETKKVSLDGVKLRADYEYLPTGISVQVTLVEAPEVWTGDMTGGLLRMNSKNIYNTVESFGVTADFYLDGAYVSEAPIPDSIGAGELRYILPVFPEDYDDLQSVELKLTYWYYETLNGTDQIGGEIFTVPQGVTETVATYRWDPLAEITVPIPKN